jgi:hypothetical protein
MQYVSMSDVDIWWDRSSAWWAKAARARKHIEDISSMVWAFERSDPYEIRSDPTGQPGELAYRVHVRTSVPPEIVTTIGDALHNMRSCLDSIAFELARQYVGDGIFERQQRAAQFPICKDRSEFDDFFDGHGVRRHLYGQREREVMRCIQPFALHDELAGNVDNWASTPELEYLIDQLARLNHLSNLDKHRRLPLVAWSLEIMYMTGDINGHSWRPERRVSPALEDGSLLGCLISEADAKQPAPEPHFQLRLALADDRVTTHELVGTLDNWHSYLVNWVLPRMFAVADGHAAPYFIGHLPD